MSKNILSLSKKLIKIQSDENNPDKLEEILEFVLSLLKDFSIEKFKKNGVKSALVYNTKERPKKFRVLFNVHLDIIPGKKEQYVPKVVSNKLFGAGAMDMKGNAATIIEVFKKVAKNTNYPIGLQLTTDEEIGGKNGTGFQVQSMGVRADFIITSEPTNFEIVYKAKGVLQIKIKSKGLTAHGAYPWRGKNAIEAMNDFLIILRKKFPNPKKDSWATTINISSIETTNKAFNKIPSDCSVYIDIRYVEKDSNLILNKIKKILPQGFNLEVINKCPNVYTDIKNKNILLLKKIIKNFTKKDTILRGANGTSDLVHFSKVKCPGIEFGPIGGGIGSDKEWVDIPSLDTYYKIIKSFLEESD